MDGSRVINGVVMNQSLKIILCAFALTTVMHQSHAFESRSTKYKVTAVAGLAATATAGAYEWYTDPKADTNLLKHCWNKAKELRKDGVVKFIKNNPRLYYAYAGTMITLCAEVICDTGFLSKFIALQWLTPDQRAEKITHARDTRDHTLLEALMAGTTNDDERLRLLNAAAHIGYTAGLRSLNALPIIEQVAPQNPLARMLLLQRPFPALAVAARGNHEATVRELLAIGADPNTANELGFTALHCAAQGGNSAIMRILAEAGADINSQTNDDHITPLGCAALAGHVDAVRTLLDLGAPVNNPDDVATESPLHRAARGNTENAVATITLLLDRGAQVNRPNAHGQTPLHSTPHAYSPYSIAIMRTLLAHGANVSMRDNNGKTPLHHAIHFNYDTKVIAIRELIAHGADHNAVDNRGFTPFHDFWTRNPGLRHTPEELEALCDLLDPEGMHINQPDSTGNWYPITFAAFAMLTDQNASLYTPESAIRMLIMRGAMPFRFHTRVNDYGQTEPIAEPLTSTDEAGNTFSIFDLRLLHVDPVTNTESRYTAEQWRARIYEFVREWAALRPGLAFARRLHAVRAWAAARRRRARQTIGATARAPRSLNTAAAQPAGAGAGAAPEAAGVAHE